MKTSPLGSGRAGFDSKCGDFELNFGKMEIVNFLAEVHGFKRFLEISTGTTGARFGDADKRNFELVHRLAYNIPAGFSDGLPIDFRSETLEIESCVAQMQQGAERYDIILVDPYHDYQSSWRDIETAFRLLTDDGMLVVHDCLPPAGGDLISPVFVPGSWCGLTFVAYVDFLIAHDVAFQTVDCDFGCGVIAKAPRGGGFPNALRAAWSAARHDPEQALKLLRDETGALLHLKTPHRFLDAYVAAAPAAVAAARPRLDGQSRRSMGLRRNARLWFGRARATMTAARR
jgi:hypothetical protein